MTSAALLPDDSERYRILVEAVTDYAIYMLDPNGCVLSWNAGARRFKGYEKHQILGQHFSAFYTQEDRDRGMPEHALKTAAAVGRFEGEGWRVRQDGTRFWANAVIDPIRNEAGELIGFAKVTRDLTERKIAEEALRESEQRFRLLVQSVIDYGIYMLDINGNVTNWNAGAERIKGYSEAEILGKHFSSFYTEEDRAAGEPERGLRKAREEGRFEKRRLARAQGRHAVSGSCGDRPDPRRKRRSGRLCQGHARCDRAARGPGGAGNRQRGLVPVAETGSAGPAHWRRGA